MIRATSRPILELPADTRVCFRCGIEWTDSHRLWDAAAPCVACRPQLVRENVDVQQFKRRRSAA